MMFLPLAALLGALINTGSVNASKRGLGWGDPHTDDDVRDLCSNGKVTWAYNWAWDPDFLHEPTVEYITMIHHDENLDGFAKNVVNKNYKTVLAFNEPERSDQANMSPDRAAYLWKTYLEPLHSQHGVRLGAPAVSSAPEGKTWLKNFIAKCDGCHIDFIPIHWYGEGDQWFTQYVQDMHNTFGKTIWVTEFADTRNNIDDVAGMLQASMNWLDGQSYVERYAWFGAFRQSATWSLLGVNGGLTKNGQEYIR